MYWDWKRGGFLLGMVFLLAVALVKPIGVSTQFVILNGIIADAVNPNLVVPDSTSKSGYSSTNAYLNKSSGKYAKSVAKPLGYGLLFVLSMVLGGFLGRLMTPNSDNNKNTAGKSSPIKQMPTVFIDSFGDRPALRYAMAFFGGALVIWGARLAGGCTSGHMMSGMMQTAVSGYLFAIAAFVGAVPVAIALYKKRY